MPVRVAINGFGRIGRDVLRAAIDRNDTAIEIVAVNDITTPETLAHLLAYDSTYGPWRRHVSAEGNTITVDDHSIVVMSEADPKDLNWGLLGVDIVIEATGRFRTRETAGVHIERGARKVLITAPGKDVDVTIVLGVNDDIYEPGSHHIISNASCTTNCAAPMAAVLDEAFGIVEGVMTTIHSYTGDQALLDRPHKDLRRARSAAVNIIPTSTGAARAIGQVIPSLEGKLDGLAVRVPVEDGSLTDLTVRLSEPATADQVNRAFAEAASQHLKGILRYTTDPVVSRDIIGDPASCVFDSSLTKVQGHVVKVMGWYDNEWGYASRTVDLADRIARTLP
ncbi:type I glyceraldehyde-3-phosphate dehydrogenase [Lentzea flaviverrucosa]|uniref:Glyceraldehyde 3-phosphate dehydrogenase n=1 Tax=Lentzea flaviverrucosa TaxID=200379 RepID=A0A1H9XWG8_9PSEU|nr:type I glyceraldehyde-3-phosphate dehydrogenase [Lentzea flaviverrucosa]RDI34301.1 glyceraldehyde 3-phosphate dehydrogenase [Lentzea flaviverrucosa]SES50528.1 glyceraldehyde 3-phosphate dehydrogenase [Lentzea flaviverrucosa]